VELLFLEDLRRLLDDYYIQIAIRDFDYNSAFFPEGPEQHSLLLRFSDNRYYRMDK